MPSRPRSPIEWSGAGDASPSSRVSGVRSGDLPMPLPSRAVEIAEAVRNAGGRALVVGGWVRDRLLSRESKDVDLEVFGVPSDRLRTLLESLGRVETVGES